MTLTFSLTLGQLLVRPARMAAGYAGGESLSDRVDAAGYVRTGECPGRRRRIVWIEGRTSDLINRGGNKVSPTGRGGFRLVPSVEDAASSGGHDRLGEVPVAVVVGDATTRSWRCAEVGSLQDPVAFHRAEALPRTEVGKLLRRQLLDDLRAGSGASTAWAAATSVQLSSRIVPGRLAPIRNGLSGASTRRMRRKSSTASRWRVRQGWPAQGRLGRTPLLHVGMDHSRKTSLSLLTRCAMRPPAATRAPHRRVRRFARQLEEIGRLARRHPDLVVRVGGAAGPWAQTG